MKPNSFFLTLLLLLIVLMGADGCDSKDAEDQQTEAVGDAISQAQDIHGQPDVNRFQEYEWATTIMELRDRGVSTVTYTEDERGRKHFMCQSLGYGIPYGVQIANPQKTAWDRHGNHALEQAEVNALYMPRNVAATWVLCSCGGDQEPCPSEFEDLGFYPHYSEPSLHVSPVELDPRRGDVISREEQLELPMSAY